MRPTAAPIYSLCGMLAARAAVSACMPLTTARLSTYMLQSCCHSSLVNLGALAERTVIQPAFHRWLSFHMLYSHLCDRRENSPGSLVEGYPPRSGGPHLAQSTRSVAAGCVL